MRRFLVLWIPLLLLVSAPLWWPAAARFLQPRADGHSPEEHTPRERSFVMQGVFFTQSRGGQEDWQIVAARLASVGGENNLRLEEVHAILFDQGESKFDITSRKAFYDRQRQRLTLQENVEVHMEKGYLLRTPVLHYAEAARQVETTAPVTISGRDLQIAGQGMAYSLATGSYWLGGRVDFVLQ